MQPGRGPEELIVVTHYAAVVQLAFLVSPSSDQLLEPLVGCDDVKGPCVETFENRSEIPVQTLYLGQFPKSFSIRRVADNEPVFVFRTDLGNRKPLQMYVLRYPGLRRVVTRKTYYLVVYVRTVYPQFSRSVYLIGCFFPCFGPKAGRSLAPGFGSKAAPRSGRHISSYQGSFDRYGPGAAERIDKRTVRLPPANHEHGRSECLLKRRACHKLPVTSFVQPRACCVYCKHCHILEQAYFYFVKRSGFLKPLLFVFLLQLLHNRLFDDSLAIRHAREL